MLFCFRLVSANLWIGTLLSKQNRLPFSEVACPIF